jgi:toxin ParE1/3/4
MAEIIWTEPALADLDAIADYIALDKPEAASALVKRVFEHVEHLQQYPESGSRPPELKRSRYRQIVEPPCRVFYRYDGEQVYILYVMRSEQLLRPAKIAAREKGQMPTSKKRP